MEVLKNLLEFRILEIGEFTFSVYNLLLMLFIFVVARLIVYFINLIVKKSLSRRKWIEVGQEFVFRQFTKYIVYTIAVVLALDSMGLDITILLAGSAALFVGLGFGIQTFFQDVVSGLIILFEGTVKVGDIIEVQTVVGRVIQINIRTSKVKTRDGIVIIIPNSKLVNDSVINWSHNNKTTRFKITVGVAYGSDTMKVKELLEEAGREHEDTVSKLGYIVRFEDFADSALLFELFFWSQKTWEIENIKSDLRFAIDQKFRENNVTIPFPQRDLHLKSKEFN